ncbi:MAG: hypothetical protein IH904_05100 [Proteobacteria bacterium]|nr:hypothetical protein [Pseudomonadota bacterium]
MGHLTKNGLFRSDKYPSIPDGYFMVKIMAEDGSFDPLGWVVAKIYAVLTKDRGLAADLKRAVREAEGRAGGRRITP